MLVASQIPLELEGNMMEVVIVTVNIFLFPLFTKVCVHAHTLQGPLLGP